jgi:hypothetical protein
LDELISNGVIVKPKRIFGVLAEILQALSKLAANGWAVGHLHPRQIKLSDPHAGDVILNLVEGRSLHTDAAEITTPTSDQRDRKHSAEATQTSDAPGAITAGGEEAQCADMKKRLRTIQSNIYLLADVAYQLLFGRKYQSTDETAASNIGKLAKRWRRVLEKALNPDVSLRYDSHEEMLQDVKRALSRNKRFAVTSLPFLLLVLLVAAYFAYERYHRYEIMTSEAGQAIESFLEIVNQTQDKFPELEKLAPPTP